MGELRSNSRFAVVILLLAVTAGFLQARRRPETTVAYEGLDHLPTALATWGGMEVPIPDDTRQVLGKGDFLQRIYRSPGEIAPIDVFVAYFPSQRVGVTIHSPKNCLPGAGWAPIENKRITIPVAGRLLEANRYIVAKGESRQLVMYWYQAHGRSVASEYWAKYYLVRDAIAMNRSDGSLIRIVTPLERDEKVDVAQERAAQFAQKLVPALAQVVPQ